MNQICSVCLMEDPDYCTECSHCFHTKCLDEWLHKNDTCPYCRKLINTRTRSVSDSVDCAGFLVIAMIIMLSGGFLVASAQNARRRNTFVFEQNCMDIPKYSKAYYIDQDYLVIEDLENFKHCEKLDQYSYDCVVSYYNFREYTLECEITNLDTFEERNTKYETASAEFTCGLVLITIGLFSFIYILILVK